MMVHRRWIFLVLALCGGLSLSRTAFAQLVAVDFWAKNAVISEETDEHFGWGGTRATFSETTIEADEMILQKEQGRLIAQGNVRMSRPGIGVYADQIVFDFASGFFQMSRPKGFFVVEMAPKDLFYFTASEMKGYAAQIEMQNITMTSCSFDCPKEYRLTGSRARLKPGKSMEVWNAAGYLYAVPVFYLPYMYLDLHQRQSQIGLRIGKNKTDGKFAYVNYTHTAKAFFIGALALALKEKSGNKYDLDERFRNKWLRYGEGRIKFGTQKEKRTNRTTQNYSLTQEIPFTDTRKLTIQINRDSSYQVFTSVRQFNQNTTLKYISGSKTFQYEDRKTLQSGGIARNKTGNLGGARVSLWGIKINVNTLNYTSNQNPGKAADELLKLDLGYSSRKGNKILQSYTLQFNRDFDLDGSKFADDNKQPVNFNYPKATFAFNSALWQKTFLGKTFLIQSVGLSGGGLKQSARDSAKKVGYGDLTISQSKQFRISRRANITFQHNFVQSMYDSGDARYTTTPRVDFRWDVFPKLKVTAGFQSNSAKGGNPFQLLSSTVSRTANWGIDLGRTPKKSLRLSTSYDLKTNRKLPITLDYNASPSQNFSLTAKTSYDSVRNQWADMTLKFALQQKPITYDVGMSYSLDRDRVLSADTRMQINIFRRTTIELRGNWSPRDKDPFIKSVLLTRYNCCTFYELAYESRTKSFIFNFGITAFPSERLRLSGGDQGLLFSPPGQGFLERGVGG